SIGNSTGTEHVAMRCAPFSTPLAIGVGCLRRSRRLRRPRRGTLDNDKRSFHQKRTARCGRPMTYQQGMSCRITQQSSHCLPLRFYFFLATRVAVAHGKFGVKLPATTGNPDFERIFRAHVNTLEWMPTFLAPLWLCAIYLSDIAAAVLGLVLIAGRAWYFAGYSRAVERRLPGFFIQSTACLLLFIGAAVGVVMHLA